MKEHKVRVHVQEPARQGSGRCGVCQARRQLQQCDSRHQELGQRSPRQAQVGQAVHRQVKSHVKSASMRLPVFLDLHALASTSKLHVTRHKHTITVFLYYTHTIALSLSLSLCPSLSLAWWNKHLSRTTKHALTLHSCCSASSLRFVLAVLHGRSLRNRTTLLSLFTD
jgi:hypothetical protein